MLLGMESVFVCVILTEKGFQDLKKQSKNNCCSSLLWHTWCVLLCRSQPNCREAFPSLKGLGWRYSQRKPW